MKRLTTIVISLLLTCTVFSAPRQLWIFESLGMYSEILGQEVKFSICLPENYYKEKTAYPLVYLLHGLGDDETSWLEYGRISQVASKLTEESEIVPMIFVMPQGFRCYYSNDFEGKFRYQDMFIKELIPYIDTHYRTIPDRQHRATVGYSMGGFGALILPLKHPEAIKTCVAMSISVRTDAQYLEEYAPEWDQQWGSIFGGVGSTGEARLTDFYKENSPFHIFEKEDLSDLKALNIYITNGDDEHTLCRSNEELHILMREKGIRHEYRIGNGGHEFSFWREGLINGLRFISDVFAGKEYRGDLPEVSLLITVTDPAFTKVRIDGKNYPAVVPVEYKVTDRKYPVIYLAGSLDDKDEKQVASVFGTLFNNGTLPPLILVFVDGQGTELNERFFTAMEKELRIRPSYRFRSVIGYEDGAVGALDCGLKREYISSCVLMDGLFNRAKLNNELETIDPESVKRTLFYVTASDKGVAFRENGDIHMIFRDKDIYHEYRVREGEGGGNRFCMKLVEALDFIANKFHD
ncbi:MAG: esterase family protein [Bacteroidales bacterium]|nr:esterase family protein [Bacteroidales bacterium]MBN2698852.1 esterase family protein [Bacteroidales bacterium]